MFFKKTVQFHHIFLRPGTLITRSERDKCRAAIGRYTGDGELSYTVSLGARPKLAVVDNTSSFSSGYELGLDGMNERSVIITEDGFRVNGSPHGLNQEGTLYRYYAFL